MTKAEEKALEAYPTFTAENMDTVMALRKSFQKGYEQGKKDMKEQMLKEAVEYEVWDFSSSLEAYPHVNIPLDNKRYRSGDKVRIIIVKEDKS